MPLDVISVLLQCSEVDNKDVAFALKPSFTL